MIRARLLPALALIAGLFTVTSDTSAQPGGGPPNGSPGQPIPGGRGGLARREAEVPHVPKSASAFVTLKVSDLAAHPDLKPVLAELAKQPDALAGVTEVIGVSPLEIDRVTLFFPQLTRRGGEPVLVVTTREPFNEARVLKALKAEPVFDAEFRGGHRHGGPGATKPKVEFKSAEKSADQFPNEKSPAPPPPPPPPKPFEKRDDTCGGSNDGGPGDPLFYALDRGPFGALFLVDENTLVFLPRRFDGEFANVALLAALLKKNATGPLADAIASAGKHTFAAGVHLKPLFGVFEHDRETPKELAPYTALFAARTAVVTGTIDKTARLNLTLTFDDAAAAKRAAPVLEEGFAAFSEKLGAEVKEMKESRRPFDKAVAPLLTVFVDGLKKATAKADGTAVTASADFDAGPVAAKALGDVLQAVQSRRKAEVRMNNLKQIGLALHNYHDVNGRLPANVYGPKGELLLSWRVQLLPYLEEDALYKQFKQDEPWDSENNKPLSEKLPKVYTAPDREHAKGKTFYQGFIAPNPAKVQPPKGIFGRPWLQEGEKNGIGINAIADGTSNTIAVIEARDGVIWSKPDDLPFGGAVPALGEKGWDRTPALRFDGSCLLFPTNMRPEEFWPYITINGGEVTSDPDDDRRFDRSRPVPVPNRDPVPANPPALKQDDVRVLEARVADATAQLKADVVNAELAARELKRMEELLKSGAGSAEEYDKARANTDAATKRVQISRDRVQQLQAQLEAAKGGSGSGSPPVRPK